MARPKGFSPGPLVRVKADDLKEFMEDRCRRGYHFIGGRSAAKVRLDTFAKFLKACEGLHPVRMYNGGNLVGRVMMIPGESVPGLNESMAGHQEEPRTATETLAIETTKRGPMAGAPTWGYMLPILLSGILSGNKSAISVARESLERMATEADKSPMLVSPCKECDQPLVQMVGELLEWIHHNEGKPITIGLMEIPGTLLWRIKQDISKRKGEVI